MPLSLTIRRLLSTQPVELPVFHPIAVRLQQLLNTSEFTIEDVVNLADEDQALSGQILKLANSTVFMGRVRVETIKEAVIRLGALQVSNLAMAASQAALHVAENSVINDCIQELWLHSHACAVGCRWMAKATCNAHLADQVYMAGLLHDVGKLYLLKALERLNKAGVAQAALDRELLLEIFSELHVEQGCRIMQHWNMPQTYINAVAFHHADTYDTSDAVVTIVRLVNTVCKKVGISPMPDSSIDVMALPEASLLGVTQDDLADLETVLEDSQDISL